MFYIQICIICSRLKILKWLVEWSWNKSWTMLLYITTYNAFKESCFYFSFFPELDFAGLRCICAWKSAPYILPLLYTWTDECSAIQQTGRAKNPTNRQDSQRTVELARSMKDEIWVIGSWKKRTSINGSYVGGLVVSCLFLLGQSFYKQLKK